MFISDSAISGGKQADFVSVSADYSAVEYRNNKSPDDCESSLDTSLSRWERNLSDVGLKIYENLSRRRGDFFLEILKNSIIVYLRLTMSVV